MLGYKSTGWNAYGRFNIKHLDKGGMTFMKKDMLGYLALVSIVDVHSCLVQPCVFVLSAGT